MQLIINQLLNPVVYQTQSGKMIIDKAMKPVNPNIGRKYPPEYAEKHKRWWELYQTGLTYVEISSITGWPRSTVRCGIAAHARRLNAAETK